MTKPLPMQPVERDERGEVRFRRNAIVEHLLKSGPLTLNDLAALTFPQEDCQQFQQLLGWSVSACPDQSPGAREAADLMVLNLDDPEPNVTNTEDYRAGFDDGYARGIEATKEALRELVTS